MIISCASFSQVRRTKTNLFIGPTSAGKEPEIPAKNVKDARVDASSAADADTSREIALAAKTDPTLDLPGLIPGLIRVGVLQADVADVIDTAETGRRTAEADPEIENEETATLDLLAGPIAEASPAEVAALAAVDLLLEKRREDLTVSLRSTLTPDLPVEVRRVQAEVKRAQAEATRSPKSMGTQRLKRAPLLIEWKTQSIQTARVWQLNESF